MLPIVTALSLIPGLGGIVEHAKAWLIETLAWLAIVVAIAVGGAVAYEHVYNRGVAAEHGHTLAVQADLRTMTARALQAEATASDNEASALALGQALMDQADAAEHESAQAHADADRYTAALDAARAARCVAGPDPIHQALTGRVSPSEDAPIPGSLRDAVRALRKGKNR